MPTSTMQPIATQAPREMDPYLEKFQYFEKAGPGKHPSWLFSIRKAALARFAELGFPTLKDEDWRFTNTAPIAQLPFKPMFESIPGAINEKALRQLPFADLKANRLVFVDGHFSKTLSTLRHPQEGVKLGSLAAPLTRDSGALQNHLPGSERAGHNPFAALNTAF